MALVIYPSQAYALLAGLFIGKFTNLFSDMVITGLVLYIVTPEIFTEDRLDRGKKYFWSWFNPKHLVTMSELSNLTDKQKIKLLLDKQIIPNTIDPFLFMKPLPKIEVMSSPQYQSETK